MLSLSTIADWLSIISFFVSAYAAYAITKVRSQIIGRVRLPQVIAALEANASELASIMRTYDDSRDQFGLELSKCEAHLRVIRGKVSQARPTVKRLLADIHRYNRRSTLFYRNEQNRSDAWKIYSRLNGLIQELTNISEEQRIGG